MRRPTVILALAAGALLIVALALRDWQSPPTSSPPHGENVARTAQNEPSPPRPKNESTVPSGSLDNAKGRLVFEAQGQQLGEESYQINRLETGEYQLTSQGYFSFKVLWVPTRFDYTQEILWSEVFVPRRYTLKMQGPLGFGRREIALQVTEGKALISTGQTQDEFLVPTERFLILGMFSSYLVIPKLLHEQAIELTVLTLPGLSGRRGQSNEARSHATFSVIRLVNSGTVEVRSGSSARDAQEYTLLSGAQNEGDQSNGSRALRLLIADGELIGVIGRGRDSARSEFKIYRADLFPDGFDVVQRGLFAP